jgi:LPS-assembly protein
LGFRTGSCVLIWLLIAAWPGFAQPTPPQFIPPPPVEQPNAANPNQRLRAPRADAPAADEVFVDAETQEAEGSLRHLRGHARLEMSDKKMEADEVDYDADTGDVEMRGHVRYQNFIDGTILNCDHGKYNANTETGIFYDVNGTSPAKIVARPGLLTTSNPFYFEGKWAERTEDRYIIHQGYVTDCKVPKPWWRLTAPKFDIIPNNRAIAYHAVFHLKRLPLLYAPAFYKSLKKVPRQSGFMTPNIGRSSLYGGMLGLAYYWAINRSYDTFYRIQYFTSRGFAHTYDLRGKVTPGTDFSLNLYGVNDRGVPIGNGQVQKQGGLTLTFDGKSTLGDGWEARAQINYLSSFLFRQAFTQSFHEAISSESHSVAYLTKHWSSYAFTVSADRQEEFQSTTPDDKIVIRKLPEVDFLGRDHQLAGGALPIWFSFESSAGFLDRTQPTFQTRQFVNRVDLYPHLTSAFHLAGFSFAAGFSVRETEYGSSVPSGQLSGADVLRNAREVRLELLPPSLERIYKSPKWLGGDKVKHVIEPRVEYRLVDGIDNFNRIIRFDQTDIMSNTNQVTVSVANRLFVKNKDGNVNEALTWEVSQSRYFDPTFGGSVIPGQRNVVDSTDELDGFAFLNGPRNYSPVVSSLRFQHRVGFEWRMDYDPLLGHVTNSEFNGNIKFSKYFVTLGHTQVRTDPVVAPNSNQINGLIGYGQQNRKGWNAAMSLYYDYKRDVLVFMTMQVNYNTDCCGFSVEYRRFNIGARDDTQYRVAFAVSNVGSFGTLRKQERIF